MPASWQFVSLHSMGCSGNPIYCLFPTSPVTPPSSLPGGTLLFIPGVYYCMSGGAKPSSLDRGWYRYPFPLFPTSLFVPVEPFLLHLPSLKGVETTYMPFPGLTIDHHTSTASHIGSF